MNYLKKFIFFYFNYNQINSKNSKNISVRSSSHSVMDSLEKENKEGMNLNDKLMKYKEFKSLYQATKIKPIYFFYSLGFCLFIMVIGYLENVITCLIGVMYPLYFSIKALREKNKLSMKNWLKYWTVFAIFLNLEGVFSYLLNDISLYFFYKVIFLLLCFLPQYNGADYFYNAFLKDLFLKYEQDVYNYSKTFAEKLRNTLLEDQDEYEQNIETEPDYIINKKPPETSRVYGTSYSNILTNKLSK